MKACWSAGRAVLAVPKGETLSPTTDAAERAPCTTYTVKEGDSLW